MDLDYGKYIPKEYLLDGFDATKDNPYRKKKMNEQASCVKSAPAVAAHIRSFFAAHGFDKGQAECYYASIHLHSSFEEYETCLMRPRLK